MVMAGVDPYASAAVKKMPPMIATDSAALI